MLRAALMQVGGGHLTYSLHNARNCVTPRNAHPDDIKASFKACKSRLHDELDTYMTKSNYLVTLGGEALKACDIQGSLLGDKTAQRGNNIPDHVMSDSTYWTFPTVHPAFLKQGRSPRYEPIFIIDIDRVVRAVTKKKLNWVPGTINLYPTVEDVEAYVEKAAPQT